MDQIRLDEIRAMHWYPDKYPAHAFLLKHIEEQDAKIEQLLSDLRKAELLCYDFVSMSIGIGGEVRGVHQCKACAKKFRSWESGDKHAENCIFAILEREKT